ncbi:acyltransferase family protein [Pelistega ratti]|uniref:acyltransferase family protein n=1 Tax=Pelistega ratti TaxID=2652177 RepID=UPI003C6E1BB8
MTLDNTTNALNYFATTWLVNGSTGVSLFLFLTGFLFCIISGYGGKKIQYKGFIYNRILRIFPLMILMVFIVITINRVNSTPMDIFRILTLQLNTGHSYTG